MVPPEVRKPAPPQISMVQGLDAGQRARCDAGFGGILLCELARNENAGFEATIHSAIVAECVKISGEIIALRSLARQDAPPPSDGLVAMATRTGRSDRPDQRRGTGRQEPHRPEPSCDLVLAGQSRILDQGESDVVTLFKGNHEVQQALLRMVQSGTVSVRSGDAPETPVSRAGEALFRFDRPATGPALVGVPRPAFLIVSLPAEAPAPEIGTAKASRIPEADLAGATDAFVRGHDALLLQPCAITPKGVIGAANSRVFAIIRPEAAASLLA